MRKAAIIFPLLAFLFGCAHTNPSIDSDISETVHIETRDINAVDESGMTPLSYAVWQARDVNAVRRLLRQGADVNIKDREGLTALEYALNSGQMKIVNVLLVAGAKFIEPTAGKARLFFIGEGVLLRDIWVTVGDCQKNLKKGRMDFLDVDPGSRKIIIPVSWYQTQPEFPVDVEEGQTYYFTISPTGSHVVSVVLGFGLFPAVIADKIGGTGPFAITSIEKSVATEKIRLLLQKDN